MHGFRYYVESTEDFIPGLLAKIRTLPDDALLHFGDLDKVGIHTRPSHQDPVGIYTFPKSYVLSPKFASNGHFFGRARVYALQVKPGQRVLNLSTLTDAEVDDMIRRMGIEPHAGTAHHLDRKGKPGHRLWDAIEHALHALDLHRQKKNLMWNKLFDRAGGFDVLVDEGDGIIHHNEPAQTVILNPRGYRVLDVFKQDLGNIYRAMGMRAFRQAADALFGAGNYRVRSRRERRWGNDYRIVADANLGGREVEMSFNYALPEDRTRVSNFVGNFYLSGTQATSYLSDMPVRTDPSDPDGVHDQVERHVKKMRAWLAAGDTFREDRTAVVAAVAREVAVRLGYSTYPPVRKEMCAFVRRFPSGQRLEVNIYVANSDGNLHCNMVIKKDRTTSPFYENYTLYGKGEVGLAAAADARRAAVDLVDQNVAEWEAAVEKYYNPDYEKHSKWDKDHGTAWSQVAIGEKLLKFIAAVRARLR